MLSPFPHSSSSVLAACLTREAVASVTEVPGASSGLHIRHGRYPACSAAAAVEKKVQFSNFGIFARHTGRQYTFVEDTPTKKRPSNLVSFALNAIYHAYFLSFSIIPPSFFYNYIILFQKNLAIFGHEFLSFLIKSILIPL